MKPSPCLILAVISEFVIDILAPLFSGSGLAPKAAPSVQDYCLLDPSDRSTAHLLPRHSARRSRLRYRAIPGGEGSLLHPTARPESRRDRRCVLRYREPPRPFAQ